jgi:hypothetical protein
MTTSAWLDIYQSSQWASFDDYAAWKSSCWLVSPLTFCTCPIGLKEYRCEHSVGLAILFNMYQIADKSCCTQLEKQKNPHCAKTPRTTL